MTTPTQTIPLRLPSSSTEAATATSAPTLTPPPLSFLLRTWHVTHSTLPMWRKARNVRITYTALPPTNTTVATSTTTTADPTTASRKLDDLVTYQALGDAKGKVKSVRGVDTPAVSATSGGKGEEDMGFAWNWRGRGWLMVASSHWEVLGYGDEDTPASVSVPVPATGEAQSSEARNKYVVTYFAKTLFTPAGLDIYSAEGTGLKEGTVEAIKKALGESADEGVRRLAGELFEVAVDGEGN